MNAKIKLAVYPSECGNFFIGAVNSEEQMTATYDIEKDTLSVIWASRDLEPINKTRLLNGVKELAKEIASYK